MWHEMNGLDWGVVVLGALVLGLVPLALVAGVLCALLDTLVGPPRGGPAGGRERAERPGSSRSPAAAESGA